MLIFLSPALLAAAIALVIHIYNPAEYILSGSIAALGVLTGIALAERIRRRHGCMDFLGRILSSPDLDKKKGDQG